MEAGNLNRRILIQKRTMAQDETGQVMPAWEDVGCYWAWIKTETGISASRSMAGADEGVARSIVRYSIRLRYRPSITDDMRIVYQGVVFEIKQVRHDLAGHDWTDLVCEEGGSHG